MMTNDEIIQFLQSVDDDSVIEYQWLTDLGTWYVKSDHDGYDFSTRDYRLKNVPKVLWAVFSKVSGRLCDVFDTLRDAEDGIKASENYEIIKMVEEIES